MKYKLIYSAFILLFSCRSIPRGVEAVKNFDKNKYLGKWFEIARIDFKFEKDLNNTTAEYTSASSGKIKVTNKGFNNKKSKWKAAVGKAKFVDSANVGKLKVSFFGPFYAGYNIIKIDTNYRYALVAGKNFNYLWLLSRTSSIPSEIKSNYLQFAQAKGFDTTRLTWVIHNR